MQEDMRIGNTANDKREALAYAYLRESYDVVQRAANDRNFVATMLAIADRLTRTLRDGGKILVAGNGGSAGDAQHIAGEFLSRLNFDRNPLPAIALTTDSSVLTAIGNDYGFEHVFERQVRALGRTGDAFLAISTSGRSPNVLAALEVARELNLLTIGFTGEADTKMRTMCDLTLIAPCKDTPLVQQIHITAAHIICGLVEQNIFGSAAEKYETASAL
jgi:D-sedoheptulose 7-phosphate isomerase